LLSTATQLPSARYNATSVVGGSPAKPVGNGSSNCSRTVPAPRAPSARSSSAASRSRQCAKTLMTSAAEEHSE
jgi:hypothetical protein